MADAEISTEADALRDILAWSSSRPVWQRDALRRLVQNGELTDEDIDELTELCKDAALPNAPLQAVHIGSRRSGAPTVSLKSIRNACNVNALAEKQSLGFIPKGVTIVYGDNGAGKSGYVRILKNACRARTVRGKDETILPNIYDSAPGPQSADFEYLAGERVQKACWAPGQANAELLSEVSVFDSRTANVHVEEMNDLAYTPYPLKLLERLVSACEDVKLRIDKEVIDIKGRTPQSLSSPTCAPETTVGKVINGLSGKTKSETVANLAALSDLENARLTELASDFAHDPEVTARRLRAQKRRLEVLRSSLDNVDEAVSELNAANLTKLAADLDTKSEAARLATQEFSGEEPLAGVGSDSWRHLWEAAREYSTAQAYPDRDFPNADDDAHCVLCHQELGDVAASRLQRFEGFVTDRTQQDELAAKQALRELQDELRARFIAPSELLKESRFLSDELGNAPLAEAVRGYAIHARWRLRAMLRRHGHVNADPPDLSEIGLGAVITALASRANALLADEQSDERSKLRSELNELQDRQWLAGIKNDVLAEIERRKATAKLQTAKKKTLTNDITSKNTRLSAALVTERLRARFAQEIDHLNLAGLAVELAQAGSQKGVSRFRVCLVQSSSQNAGQILSEGEYRCVALAGFMAELVTNDSDSAIIFDDPVSSLDHLHREAIAKRLAEEGRRRQVIVFTHDLPFLFLLRNACRQVEDSAQQTEIALRHIQKRNDTPGYCRQEPPDKAQGAEPRLAAMRKHLSNTRIQYDQDPDSTTWLITARGLINSLRQAWEAAVEDAISPVLRTFSSKVNTKGFAKLSAITQEDAETMRRHYGQCSEILHKASDEMNPTAPDPDTMNSELDALDSWLSAVIARQAAIHTR